MSKIPMLSLALSLCLLNATTGLGADTSQTAPSTTQKASTQKAEKPKAKSAKAIAEKLGSQAPGVTMVAAILPYQGAHGIFSRNEIRPGVLANDPVLMKLTIVPAAGQSGLATVELSATDAWDKPVSWTHKITLDLSSGTTEQYIPFPAQVGYFQIHAQIVSGTQSIHTMSAIGILPTAWPGVRPDSFFATNANLKTGMDLDLLQSIGMKIVRAHFYPEIAEKGEDWAKSLPTTQPPALNFSKQDKIWAQMRARGIWALPVIGYSVPNDISKLGVDLGMYGPPADEERFANTWIQIAKHYPEITTYEFWNEPWIFGWTFAGTPTDYCRLQKLTLTKMLALNPNYRIVAGNSTMFVTDNVEPRPEAWKGLLSGVTHHPYTASVGARNFRCGDNQRSIDDNYLTAKRMGLPYAYLTEGGTSWSPQWEPEYSVYYQVISASDKELKTMTTPEEMASPRYALLQKRIVDARLALSVNPKERDDLFDASKIVQYYVRAAVDGMFQGNAQWEIGYGPDWTRSNVTFGIMTHMLEDRPAVADIWPSNELVYGVIFANPRFIDDRVKALPRANELSARWSVPIPSDRADDTTRVAVVFGLLGDSNQKLDGDATLTMSASGLRAYDMTGREIPATSGKLIVPLNQYPVYITTESLSVVDLKTRIADGSIQTVAPVNLYALSLGDDASRAQKLAIRVENQVNRKIEGVIRLKIANVDKEVVSSTFSIDASKLTEVLIDWPGVPASVNNQYPITLQVDVNEPAQKPSPANAPATKPTTVTRSQVISSAKFIKRTITVDGSLEDWKGATPVLIDSALLSTSVDVGAYLLNPHMDSPTVQGEGKRIVAKVYTAYDDANVYLAAAVNEDSLSNPSGEQVVKGRRKEKITLPYKTGEPDGLTYVTNLGDVFQFSFGFRDRVPGWGRTMDDPYAWKGMFYDTDYSYVAHVSTTGDKLIRIWDANGPRRNGYQTEATPGIGPVTDAKIKITRDETKKLTIYEMSIPRKELALFDPKSERCRFGFILVNDEKLGPGRGLRWSEAAGVFDHWTSSGSFPPTWEQRPPCQTFFGIEK